MSLLEPAGTMTIAKFIRESVLRPRLEKQAGAWWCTVTPTNATAVVFRSVGRQGAGWWMRLAASKAVGAAGTAVGAAKAPLEGVLICRTQSARKPTSKSRLVIHSPYTRNAARCSRKDDGTVSLVCACAPGRITPPRSGRCTTSPSGLTFAVIDTIGSGVIEVGPSCEPTLRVESGRRFSPHCWPRSIHPIQKRSRGRKAGCKARNFLKPLGLSVKTRVGVVCLADELWRYVLFSEFVFDLRRWHCGHPEGVPHAPMEARPIVRGCCDPSAQRKPKVTRDAISAPRPPRRNSA